MLKENSFGSKMPNTSLFANMTVEEIARALSGSPPLAGGAEIGTSQDVVGELSEDPDWRGG
jgi:hypothetical protein